VPDPDRDHLGQPKKITPMMRQYLDAKNKHPGAVLLFRMGDFYEMFYEDAEHVSKILDIALTTRDRNKPDAIPMCGFPHHSASSYISKLLSSGLRVAICDQVEDPKEAQGLVRREVTRVLTPGLHDEAEILKTKENNFLIALSMTSSQIAIASFDLSTGDFLVTSAGNYSLADQEIARLDPKEILIPEKSTGCEYPASLKGDFFYINHVADWMCDPDNCSETLKEHFGLLNLQGFGLLENSPMSTAAGTIINYVKSTRNETPIHIKPLRVYSLGKFMIIDQYTLRNLELFKNIKDGSNQGSLLKSLDRTVTSMGARLLRNWVSYPLLDPLEISERTEAVDCLLESPVVRREIRASLKDIGDIERIAARISLRNATPRDLVQLKTSAEKIPVLLDSLNKIQSSLILKLKDADDLSYVVHATEAVLVASPPATIKDGGVVRPGYNSELDDLREIRINGKEWIAGIEARERGITGVNSLKVGFNRVFGYFIEITRAHVDKVPPNYIRKQTLVNAERYITEELKEYELKVLNAQENIQKLEEQIFDLLRTKLLEVIPRIQKTASAIAQVDVLASLAEVAAAKNYCRPRVHDGDEILIVEGRHPVVEDLEKGENFVPNDVRLDLSSHQILIITGPNMAGKSTYLRQTALITLMAQIGSFVPASEASIGIVDRIFTRIGAADYLAFGQSTFMVEMNETASILHNSTCRSLVLLDEVGRGTSTFDGLSIAWAVTEYLHDKAGGGPRTLFATHYHELVDIALIKHRVKNYNVQVREWKESIVFLRKIVPGGVSRSYGIQVAKLAGIPAQVVDRAKEILTNLEKKEIDPGGLPSISRVRNPKKKSKGQTFQSELFPDPADQLLKDLEQINVEAVTPLNALSLLADWKTKYTSHSNDQ
jgi:DNA mismatch repair protein MutS